MKHLLSYLLKLVNPHKPLGTILFNAIARVSVSVAFEAVAFRRNNKSGQREVYLVKRPKDDTAYPGQWHVPGSILRPKEKDEHVLLRLGKNEFGAKIINSKFIAILSHPGEVRGHFLSLVYVVSLDGEPKGAGDWFPVNKLPAETVRFHKKYLIPIAAKDHRFEDLKTVKIRSLEV